MDARSIRVPEDRIKDNLQAALGIVREAQAPAQAAARPAVGRVSLFPAAGTAPTATSTQNLETALRGGDGDALVSPERYAVLFAARRALAVGMTVSEMFVEPLGFVELGKRNQGGTLHGADLDRFRALARARSAVAAYAAAASLFAARGAAPSGEAGDAGDVPEKATEALGWLVHRVAEAARGRADADLDGAVARACSDVMDAVESSSTRTLGPFSADFLAAAYTVESDDFRVHGFDRPGSARRKATVEMQFKRPDEVVGNHIAKSQALRLSKMIACHDFATGKNPFVELGGFVFTFIGDGNPGTGKTTIIQMAAGLMKGYCDVGGYGFHCENFGVDNISEFQGKSGQNAKAFIERILDPRVIGFGTIDDVDQVAGKRDDQRASGGQQEVTAVLMDAFAGANTVVRGNCTFGMFSNYPEKVDDALRQRAGARWLVDGPQTADDYVDIASLLLGKNHSIPVGDHDLFAAQEIKRMVAQSYDGFSVPTDEKLLGVWNGFVSVHGEPTTIAGIGRYLHAIKELEPRFTGRAIKNVMDAVKLRAMDFELPDEWFEMPTAFMHRPYEEKLAMISELRRPITIAMVIQEANRYAESELRYSDKSDEAAIAGIVRDNRVLAAAQERIRSGARA